MPSYLSIRLTLSTSAVAAALLLGACSTAGPQGAGNTNNGERLGPNGDGSTGAASSSDTPDTARRRR